MNYNDYEIYYNECKPTPIEPSSEHHDGAYNCHDCEDTLCPYWSEFNEW